MKREKERLEELARQAGLTGGSVDREAQMQEMKEKVASLFKATGPLPRTRAHAHLRTYSRVPQMREALRAEFEQQLQQARADASQRQANLQTMGVGMVADPTLPHLMNLSEDPSLAGALVYYLKPGSLPSSPSHH